MERRTLFVLFSILLAGTPTLGQRDDSSEALVSVNVGVILDMGTLVGKMCWTSISMAVDDFYAANRNFTTRLVLHLRDGEASVISAGSAALGLLHKEGVLAIFGPQKSAQARFLSDIADKARVPSISFTATSPLITSSARSYFVRMAINDSAQVDAVASIVRYYAWREVVIIHEDTDYGNGVIPYLIDALQANSIRVPHRTVIPPSATDDQIKEELLNLKMIQTRVFIVHMSLPVGTRVFSKAKAIGMTTKGFAWIVTDGIANLVDSVDHEVISAMQGFVGVKPYVPRTAELEAFIRRWKRKYRNENPEAERIDPSIFSLWAYDSVRALALAVEKVEVKRFSFEKPRIFGNSTDLDALIVSKMGPTILKAVIETSFTGLSGEFRLVNGQLQSSAYQIVNVVGNGQKGIGFWTPKRGLSPQLGSPTNKDELGAVVWPGDSTSVPRGWEITTGGRRLRVAVPVKHSFFEFVRFDEDPVTKENVPTGYSIEIFDKVMKSLPYYVPFDYFHYAIRNGVSASYDLLLQQVPAGDYDDVAGDVTILARRFQYVDFTLPYTESGVYMILWLCSLCFFVFTGFILWGIERMHNNEHFMGPPLQVISNVLYFTFSTFVFAHKQELKSSLSKTVIIVWLFAVLILTSTYTASLASILTTANLKPAFNDVGELVRSGKFVGYSRGSFQMDLLKPTFGSKLIPLSGPDKYASALTKGTVNAVLHELPYVKLFLKKYCKGYTIIGPTQKTLGFGFAFRKNSPLLSDVSKAVVTLMQSPLMDDIEKRWMLTNDTSQCPQADAGGSHITLHRLRGLFVFTGIISSMALLVACIENLLGGYQNPRVRPPEPTLEEEDEPLADDEQPPVDVGLPEIGGPGRDSGAKLEDSGGRGLSMTENSATSQGHREVTV
ncbi:unnamed protein product [Spirodela intermedia]|uniref:Glutamate receptor n=1 Tax=Spirodela intermedia TaxID=51605 RepID=A0A7I8LDF9_SPIIN|nr:unnamed protein product [Spirodela intermedia]